MEIYEEIVRLKRDGRPSAVATIVECRGSSPQKQGAKMLVRDDGSIVGTLGGGCLEAEVIQSCLMAIRDGACLTVPFDLTDKEGGLVCGGRVLVYVEPVFPSPRIFILGAGHVGRALSTVARFSGFRVTIVDDRQEFANKESVPDADEWIVHDFSDISPILSASGVFYTVIATRGHNHDLEALRAALKSGSPYIGLLGSRRKKALLFGTLASEGFTKEEVERVAIPVGLPIGSVTPEEIAISIIAQIIQRRRGNAINGVSHSSCCGDLREDGDVKATPAPFWQAGHQALPGHNS